MITLTMIFVLGIAAFAVVGDYMRVKWRNVLLAVALDLALLAWIGTLFL